VAAILHDAVEAGHFALMRYGLACRAPRKLRVVRFNERLVRDSCFEIGSSFLAGFFVQHDDLSTAFFKCVQRPQRRR
jgi:hypothetical protein